MHTEEVIHKTVLFHTVKCIPGLSLGGEAWGRGYMLSCLAINIFTFQLRTCCVGDILQTSKDAFNLLKCS